MKEHHEPLVLKLRTIARQRRPADFERGLFDITRQDIKDILAILDPPDEHDAMFRDAKGDKIRLDDWVEYTDLEFNEYAGRFAKVVGLSDEHEDDVLVVRFSGETRCRKIHPGRVTLARAAR